MFLSKCVCQTISTMAPLYSRWHRPSGLPDFLLHLDTNLRSVGGLGVGFVLVSFKRLLVTCSFLGRKPWFGESMCQFLAIWKSMMQVYKYLLSVGCASLAMIPVLPKYIYEPLWMGHFGINLLKSITALWGKRWRRALRRPKSLSQLQSRWGHPSLLKRLGGNMWEQFKASQQHGNWPMHRIGQKLRNAPAISWAQRPTLQVHAKYKEKVDVNFMWRSRKIEVSILSSNGFCTIIMFSHCFPIEIKQFFQWVRGTRADRLRKQSPRLRAGHGWTWSGCVANQ